MKRNRLSSDSAVIIGNESVKANKDSGAEDVQASRSIDETFDWRFHSWAWLAEEAENERYSEDKV